MELDAIKREIFDYIDKADSRFIKLVYSMVIAEKEDLFIKFDTDDMEIRAELSEQDIAAGRTIKADDLKLEFKNWKKKRNPSK